MKIVVFGATGGCGAQAVKEGARRGHEVVAAVRPASARRASFADGVRVAECEPYTGEGVADALSGADAVVSCLGIRRRNPLNPWSRLVSPADTTERATSNIAAAMREQKVGRLAVISAGGVGDSRPRTALLIRIMIAHSNMAPAYADLERMEAVLATSGLDWLALRPTTLTNARSPHRAEPCAGYGLLSRIPRAAVAATLLEFAQGAGGASPGARMVTGVRG